MCYPMDARACMRSNVCTCKKMESEFDLLPLESSKSSVWSYFGFPSRDGEFLEKEKKKRQHVYCKLCRKKLKYVSNTTNLIVHMKNHHASEYGMWQEAEKGPRVAGAARSTTSKAESKQQSIKEALQGVQPMPHSSQKWKKLTESVCYFIAKDGQPLDTVHDKGFRHLLRSFEPSYVPPDRKTITNKYLPELYMREKEAIGKRMEQALYFAVTTDGWTSRANDSYVSLTVHYIDEEWALQSHLLETSQFPDGHTGENLASGLEGMLERWKLPAPQLSAATTDNAANIVLAMQILEWEHMRCFNHSLQLAINQTFAILHALARARNLVSHFHHSAKSSHLLKEKQRNLKHPAHNLVQQVVTRWNSTYIMLQRVLEQQQPLCAALLEVKRPDLMPTDSEITAMETFIEVMEPFVKITEIMGAEKWVTISAVRPLLHKLCNLHLPESSPDSRLKKQMKSVILQKLQLCYTQPSSTSLLDKACFLDPRFKTLNFLLQADRKAVIQAVEEELAVGFESLDARDSDTTTTSSDIDEPSPKRPKKGGLMALLSDVLRTETSDNSPIDTSEKIRREIAKYIALEPDKDCHPLKWWKENSSKLPLLSKLAKKYLCVPATSVPSERAFSLAGYIVNQRRACLLPRNVNMLVFLAENLD